MSFDRKGKCPICKKPFQSDACKHSYDYVHRVMDAAKNKKQFERDVAKIRRR